MRVVDAVQAPRELLVRRPMDPLRPRPEVKGLVAVGEPLSAAVAKQRREPAQQVAGGRPIGPYRPLVNESFRATYWSGGSQ